MKPSDNRTVVVVGDNFATFGSQQGAMPVSKLGRLLDRGTDATVLPTTVVIGQGVSEGWLSYLKERAAVRGLAVGFVGEEFLRQRTGRSYAHKRQRKNILITDPVRSGTNEYRCALAVDDDCEMMSDHTTGHHLQGMLLLEAARQTFLAVTEWFMLDRDEPYYFVINSMDVSYKQFAFPVHTEIVMDVVSADSSKADRVAVVADIRFMQLDQCVTSVRVQYTAILSARLEPKEADMAKRALDATLAKAGVPAPQPQIYRVA